LTDEGRLAFFIPNRTSQRSKEKKETVDLRKEGPIKHVCAVFMTPRANW
jgi:hypothetical protein